MRADSNFTNAHIYGAKYSGEHPKQGWRNS